MSLSRALATLSPLGLVRSGVFSLAPPTTSPSRGGYGRHSNLTPFILYTSDWSLTGPRRRQLSRATFKNLDRTCSGSPRGARLPTTGHFIHLARAIRALRDAFLLVLLTLDEYISNERVDICKMSERMLPLSGPSRSIRRQPRYRREKLAPEYPAQSEPAPPKTRVLSRQAPTSWLRCLNCGS